MCLGSNIGGCSSSAPITNANFLQLGRGLSLLGVSSGTIQNPLLIDENDDGPLKRPVGPSHLTDLDLALRSRSEVYLRALREYINQRGGSLIEGWSVDFFYCQKMCKTSAVYCTPDGSSRFTSMDDVAKHLGLQQHHSLQAENRNDVLTTVQRRVHMPQVRNQSLKFSRGNSSRENQNHGSAFQDLFPVQFEDLFILSMGVIDSRPSYHNHHQIWPVGYRSCWHDRITGSIFISEVLDGGDAGPLFKVRRSSCSSLPLLVGSTVLIRRNPILCNGKEKVSTNGSSSNVVNNDDDDDETLSIKMILKEDTPPNLGEIDFRKASSSYTPKEIGDCISEFSVESRSSLSAWKMASQALIHACYASYRQNGSLKFHCKHKVDGVGVENTIDPLSRFSCRSGPTDRIPEVIRNASEFEAGGKMLIKWLQQDRFGLDAAFVQEILEIHPRVQACSSYIVLSRRVPGSNLLTVQSGFLRSKRKRSDALDAKEPDGHSLTEKRPRRHLEESAHMKSFPLGKPFSKLPLCLVGDVLQGWEFLWRFSEVLGLEEPFLFEELENELIDPWVGTINQAQEDESENRDITSCTGVALRKAHCSLLKPILSELVTKLAPYVDSLCESREGKKKDAESSSIMKQKFDMLQINELTWPELARRYILVILLLEGNLETAEINSYLGNKILHCLRGDGGTLCGSLTGVAGMEADARLLAEAQEQVFGLPKTNEIVSVDQQKPEAISTPKVTEQNDDGIPEWAQVLLPVRGLPTNVGARIRNRVYRALELNPPERAKKILEYSIRKDIYKGNASGPTKRAVVSLLSETFGNSLQSKPEPEKETSACIQTFSDLLMKQCRIVLRRAAAEDKKKVFCTLLGKTLCPNENDDEGILGPPASVSRPLDFRVIDFRLAAGAYSGSHEAFFEDVCELWNNIRSIYSDRSDILKLVGKLSHKFKGMYEKEVLLLVQKLPKNLNSSCITDEAKREMDDQLLKIMESSLSKATWEEGICQVCGVDKDDDNVLLCDYCDSEYHKYCLNPPLAIIPEGNWYCPSCVNAGRFKKSKGKSRGVQVARFNKQKVQGEFTRQLMETLSPLAQSMRSKEYWNLNTEERTLLFRFLCDETLNTSTLHDHMKQSISSVAVRKEILGRDSANRIYWEFGRPSTCSLLVDRSLENPNEEYFGTGYPRANRVPSSGWISYQSDGELLEIVQWLSRGEARDRELRDSILQWQNCKANKKEELTSSKIPETRKPLTSDVWATKAAAIVKKRHGLGESRLGNKDKSSNEDGVSRCDCLELIWSSKHHCFTCHKTHPTGQEFLNHFEGNCMDLEEESLKEKKIILEPSPEAAVVPKHMEECDGLQIRRQRVTNGGNKGSVVPESSLSPTVTRESAILRQLQMHLLDINDALPEGAVRLSMAQPARRVAWCSFVKSARSIQEMVQATIVLENLIRADNLRREWWYSSSLSAAANISTLSALAFRLSTLEAAIIVDEPLPVPNSTEVSEADNKEDELTAPKSANGKEKACSSKPKDSLKQNGKANKRRKASQS